MSKQRPGFCPKCGQPLEYGDWERCPDGEGGYWECFCPDSSGCDWRGQEWYTLMFSSFYDEEGKEVEQ